VTSIHAVQLEVKLKKSGAVLEAKFLLGPAELRKAAIKAVKARNYKRYVTTGSSNEDEIWLHVTFPQGRKGPAVIAREVIAGVPGCVYATRVRVAPTVVQLHLVQRVEPIFPQEMRDSGNKLVLQILIDKDGNVSGAEKISGPDEFASAAIDAVKQWKFVPYILNGTSVEIETTLSLPYEPLTYEPLQISACIPNLPCPHEPLTYEPLPISACIPNLPCPLI
jgi:hypothetical protein